MHARVCSWNVRDDAMHKCDGQSVFCLSRRHVLRWRNKPMHYGVSTGAISVYFLHKLNRHGMCPVF